MPVRKHRCVGNHVGSAKLMECKSRVQEIKELSDKETLVEVLERSGNTTVLAHIKRDLHGTLKKRYDCNCIVNNIVTDLYAVKKNSKCVIQHIQKCLKSAFSKNEGVKTGMEESLRAIVPHQFLDFSYHPRFCGVKRKQQEIYICRGLPYKTSFKDNHLRFQLGNNHGTSH